MVRRSTVPKFVRERREKAGLQPVPSTPRSSSGQGVREQVVSTPSGKLQTVGTKEKALALAQEAQQKFGKIDDKALQWIAEEEKKRGISPEQTREQVKPYKTRAGQVTYFAGPPPSGYKEIPEHELKAMERRAEVMTGTLEKRRKQEMEAQLQQEREARAARMRGDRPKKEPYFREQVAERLFGKLGYDVSRDGTQIRAVKKGEEVRLSPKSTLIARGRVTEGERGLKFQEQETKAFRNRIRQEQNVRYKQFLAIGKQELTGITPLAKKTTEVGRKVVGFTILPPVERLEEAKIAGEERKIRELERKYLPKWLAGPKITPELIQKRREDSFLYGQTVALYGTIRKPAKPIAVAGAFAAMPFALKPAAKVAKKLPTLIKTVGKPILKYGLPATYGVGAAVRVKAAPTKFEKGKVTGEILYGEVAPALIGSKVGAELYTGVELRRTYKTELQKSLVELPPTQRKQVLEYMKQVEGIPEIVAEPTFKSVERLPSAAREPVLKYIRERGLVVSGGAAELRSTEDVDLHAISGEPRKYAKEMVKLLQQKGIKRVSIAPKTAEVTIAGKKTIEIHKAEKLLKPSIKEVVSPLIPWQSQIVKTPKGTLVTKHKILGRRKIAGAVVGKREKDIPNLQKLLSGVKKVATAQMKKEIDESLFFRETKLKKLAKMRAKISGYEFLSPKEYAKLAKKAGLLEVKEGKLKGAWGVIRGKGKGAEITLSKDIPPTPIVKLKRGAVFLKGAVGVTIERRRIPTKKEAIKALELIKTAFPTKKQVLAHELIHFKHPQLIEQKVWQKEAKITGFGIKSKYKPIELIKKIKLKEVQSKGLYTPKRFHTTLKGVTPSAVGGVSYPQYPSFKYPKYPVYKQYPTPYIPIKTTYPSYPTPAVVYGYPTPIKSTPTTVTPTKYPTPKITPSKPYPTTKYPPTRYPPKLTPAKYPPTKYPPTKLPPTKITTQKVIEEKTTRLITPFLPEIKRKPKKYVKRDLRLGIKPTYTPTLIGQQLAPFIKATPGLAKLKFTGLEVRPQVSIPGIRTLKKRKKRRKR